MCYATSVFDNIPQTWKPGENIRSSSFVRTRLRSNPKFNACSRVVVIL